MAKYRASKTDCRFFEEIPPKRQFLCPFCGSDLHNGSFTKSEIFIYMTCRKCYKQIIMNRKDYENFVRGVE